MEISSLTGSCTRFFTSTAFSLSAESTWPLAFLSGARINLLTLENVQPRSAITARAQIEHSRMGHIRGPPFTRKSHIFYILLSMNYASPAYNRILPSGLQVENLRMR